MDPIQYGAGSQNPMQSFTSALQMGNSIMQAQAAAAQAQAQIAAQKAEAERVAKFNEMVGVLTQPGAKSADFLKASLYLPKDQAEVFREAGKGLSEEQRKAAIVDTANVYGALEAGRSDIAINKLKQTAEAYRAEKNEAAAAEMDELVRTIQEEKDGASAVKVMLGLQLTGYGDDGKKAVDGIAAYGGERRSAQEQPLVMEGKAADIEFTRAQTIKALADAEKTRLENERPGGVDIDESARKIMNAAAEEIYSADLLAGQAVNLASEFDRLKPPGGWGGNFMEQLKKAAGGQDKLTTLRQEYVRLRNTDVLKNLPPGVASDKDIEIALKAFPDESANPDQVSAFLRGVAKLQAYKSSVNKAKAEWVNQNGSLGPARSDFTAGGKTVKRGMAFWDFTKDIPMPNTIGASTAATATAGGTTAKPVSGAKAPVEEVDY